MKRILYVFAFVFIAFVFCGVSVSAKVSDSEVFEIEVGKEDTLNVYYTLEEDSDKNVKERINFAVTLKGLSETKNDYRWEHTFCYAINNGEEICEYDLTGSDQENQQYIYSNQTYNFTFYDGDMPYYSEDLYFDYVVFKNKFVCLDCESDSEIVLEDIIFEKEKIDYKYNYDINVSYVENESKKYVVNYSSNEKVFIKATFVNNSGSSLVLENAPVYKLINEVCVEDSNCHEEIIDKVYSSGDSDNSNPFSITPYLGNLSFYYYGDNLIYDSNNEISYEFAKYKTTLICLNNCESRRVDSEVVVHEENYYFDYTKPIVDEENTNVNSYSEVEYVKQEIIKITIKDLGSGVDETTLKYYLGWNNKGSCSFSNVFSYENGKEFILGENLKDGAMCMYYVASDKLGNKFYSDNYYYYFDNKGPVMNFNNKYNSSTYYNEVVVNPSFSDGYSGLKETYYFWSKTRIDKENYILVKNNGKLLNDTISSRELTEDGGYYLYVLSFDNLDNYSFNELGFFNIDTKGLEISEVIVETTGLSEFYSNTAKIKLKIDQIEDDEEFKCGFFTGENVSVEDLTVSCYNNKEFDIPWGYEGEYNLFVYVRDRANNYSLFKVLKNLKIDTKSPSVEYSLLYDDDKYRLVNEITINVSDLSGVNGDYLKYSWISKNKVNVVSSDLSNAFKSGDKIEYPKGYYGEYKLYILSMDNIGNEKLIAIDKVFKIDTDIIRISLIGEENITLLKGETYEDLGAVAYKGEVISGGRVSDVIVEGKVDSNKVGVYYITYTSGEGDLLVSVTRKVVVKDNSIYIISCISFFVIGGLIICLRLFIKKEGKE